MRVLLEQWSSCTKLKFYLIFGQTPFLPLLGPSLVPNAGMGGEGKIASRTPIEAEKYLLSGVF